MRYYSIKAQRNMYRRMDSGKCPNARMRIRGPDVWRGGLTTSQTTPPHHRMTNPQVVTNLSSLRQNLRIGCPLMQWSDLWCVGREGWHEGWSPCPDGGRVRGPKGTGTEVTLPQALIEISFNSKVTSTKKCSPHISEVVPTHLW